MFDLNKVTIEHPKPVTILSKLIKQPKSITQQPNKIKVHTELKAADRMLHLDLIKRLSS